MVSSKLFHPASKPGCASLRVDQLDSKGTIVEGGRGLDVEGEEGEVGVPLDSLSVRRGEAVKGSLPGGDNLLRVGDVPSRSFWGEVCREEAGD